MPPAAFPTRLGNAVAAQRRARKLTQEQLAEAAGISTEWISRMERGVGAPSIDMLVQLAKVLKVPAADLVAAAEDRATGRASVQQLLAAARGLPDDSIDVLIATAGALAAKKRK